MHSYVREIILNAVRWRTEDVKSLRKSLLLAGRIDDEDDGVIMSKKFVMHVALYLYPC